MPRGLHPRKKRPLADRFWEKVQVGTGDECWLWLGAKDPNGYGQLNVDGRGYGAHRVSYELNIGPIQPGFVPDHLCRNPSCVNPKHLEAVTMLVNTQRGELYAVLRRKAETATTCIRGHAWTPENTGRNNKGRYCKACQRQKGDAWRAEHHEHVMELQRRRRAAERGRAYA